jgi:hypothetical protein
MTKFEKKSIGLLSTRKATSKYGGRCEGCGNNVDPGMLYYVATFGTLTPSPSHTSHNGGDDRS